MNTEENRKEQNIANGDHQECEKVEEKVGTVKTVTQICIRARRKY